LFLYGSTTKKQREEMIDRFQHDPESPPIMILSLKAGGVGLNLTRANHVFHFDRWWNPAVENQATDRVFRIGQTRNVQVHKFVCTGTLEEKINDMIEKYNYYASIMSSSNPHTVTTPYGENIILFKAGDTTYKLRTYKDAMLKHEDIAQELLLDEILTKCGDSTVENLDLTGNEFDDLLNYQIMLGYFYTDFKCKERLSLPGIKNLNVFVRTIVKMVIAKTSSI
jgi:hypothetical protein